MGQPAFWLCSSHSQQVFLRKSFPRVRRTEGNILLLIALRNQIITPNNVTNNYVYSAVYTPLSALLCLSVCLYGSTNQFCPGPPIFEISPLSFLVDIRWEYIDETHTNAAIRQDVTLLRRQFCGVCRPKTDLARLVFLEYCHLFASVRTSQRTLSASIIKTIA